MQPTGAGTLAVITDQLFTGHDLAVLAAQWRAH